MRTVIFTAAMGIAVLGVASIAAIVVGTRDAGRPLAPRGPSRDPRRPVAAPIAITYLPGPAPAATR